MSRQTPLPLSLNDESRFENFVATREHAFLLNTLQRAAQGECAQLYLSGPRGTGKTHLLQATVQASVAHAQSAFYFSFKVAATVSPDILENMSQFSVVCWDDMQAIAGDLVWERAVFHAYNQLQAASRTLIVSADQPAIFLPFALPDLQSRLSSLLMLPLPILTDTEKRAVLIQRADYRGLALSAEAADYILHHFDRDLASLMMVLDALDQAALADQRKLTIPFIKQMKGMMISRLNREMSF